MKKIKVLLFIRSDCETNVGGDFYQLLQYFNALKSNGHKVEIAKGPKKELGEYEVVHIFNTYRVKESYLQLAYAKAAKVATILTPIWHSDELIKHLYWSKFRIPRIFYRPLKAFREYRYCRLNKIKIRVSESIRYTQMQKELISGVDYVIPNSSAELFFIEKELEIRVKNREIIPNTVDPLYLKPVNNESTRESTVLCIGRIEPLKNQLEVIKAFSSLSMSNVKIIFIGKIGSHTNYNRKFEKMVRETKNCGYLGELTQLQLLSYYHKARGVIHASMFETTGLIGMEALCCGCSLSITDNPYTRDYYSGFAHFCNPNIRDSIKKGLEWIFTKASKPPNYNATTIEELYVALIQAYDSAVNLNER